MRCGTVENRNRTLAKLARPGHESTSPIHHSRASPPAQVHRTEIEYQQERRKQILDFSGKGASGGANDPFAEFSQAAPERHPDDRFDDFMWRLYLWRLYVVAAVEMLVAKWTDSFYTQFMIGILGVLDAVLYVILTYKNDTSSSGSNSKLGWTVYAYGFSTSYYCVDFLCFSFDAEGGPLTYVLSVQGLLDLVAVIEGTAELLVNQNTVFLRIFKLFKVSHLENMFVTYVSNGASARASDYCSSIYHCLLTPAHFSLTRPLADP